MFNEIHNITEDIVFTQVTQICDAIDKEVGTGLCTCPQCRRDTACYVLNRSIPRYVISNRGVARAEQDNIERQQTEADIAALIHEGIHQVNHNQRPLADHAQKSGAPGQILGNIPSYNIPTIIGRVFNGLNFEPLPGATVELLRDGELVPMKDSNWQNPYGMVANTAGTFTFWPASIPAESVSDRRVFQYAIKIEFSDLETLIHPFSVPVTAEFQVASAYSMDRTYKLPDLYLFPPGGDDQL